jgi:uncharacterized protein
VTRGRLLPVSFALVVAVTLGGCSFPGMPAGGGEFATTGEVTVNALYASGDTGGVAQQTISMSPSDDGGVRIDFSENEVTGFGDMTRAASWNAVTVATLLTGAPLDRQYRFAFDGQIDGPSAGALTTVGVLSLILGDELKVDVTMTGTINPTGTVGTVGGIPEKIQGVIDAGKISTVLIPAGQRNTPNSAGQLVDVVDLGSSHDVEVVEVATIYDAYPAMTGEQLPTPTSSSTPQVDENGYDKLKAATDEALARFDRAAAEFSGLDPTVQSGAGSTLVEAQAQATRARDLQVQGLQAGAFVEAQGAAATMETLFSAFDTVQGILTSGFGALDTKLAAGETAIDELNAHIDSLGTYNPKTLTDVEALVTSYGNAFDSLSLLNFGSSTLQSALDTANAGGYESVEAFLTDILLPLLYFEFGRGQLEFSKAVFDIGRDNDGSAIDPDANLDAIGSFLRRGADANWAAFESGVIATNAESDGVSNDVFRDRLSSVDLTVALSYSAQNEQATLEQYIGEGEPNAAYAAMGYGYLNYARNAILLEKYYNNGVLDETLTIVGVNSDTILSAALDLGRTQVARALSVLFDKGTSTVLTVGAFEQAGVDREGTVTDKFDAIGQYSGAFMLARTMAFVGGFPAQGWKRNG